MCSLILSVRQVLLAWRVRRFDFLSLPSSSMRAPSLTGSFVQRLRRKVAARKASVSSSSSLAFAEGLSVKIASYQSASGSHVTHFPVISSLAVGDYSDTSHDSHLLASGVEVKCCSAWLFCWEGVLVSFSATRWRLHLVVWTVFYFTSFSHGAAVYLLVRVLVVWDCSLASLLLLLLPSLLGLTSHTATSILFFYFTDIAAVCFFIHPEIACPCCPRSTP